MKEKLVKTPVQAQKSKAVWVALLKQKLSVSSASWKAGWQNLIDVSQAEKEFQSQKDGKTYQRLPSIFKICVDCEVKKGQIHVVGCCREVCPRCSDQLLFCACFRLDE